MVILVGKYNSCDEDLKKTYKYIHIVNALVKRKQRHVDIIIITRKVKISVKNYP